MKNLTLVFCLTLGLVAIPGVSQAFLGFSPISNDEKKKELKELICQYLPELKISADRLSNLIQESVGENGLDLQHTRAVCEKLQSSQDIQTLKDAASDADLLSKVEKLKIHCKLGFSEAMNAAAASMLGGATTRCDIVNQLYDDVKQGIVRIQRSGNFV